MVEVLSKVSQTAGDWLVLQNLRNVCNPSAAPESLQGGHERCCDDALQQQILNYCPKSQGEEKELLFTHRNP